ncbi:IL-6 subfamily cytokine M17 isoform X2 [Polypterus senegalus]|uniref:IL-6 subfamily cytokine M17 isoform X2 n=1 Tax=Polypterus senegalus TaxID=55291 RepID=UPI00196348CC|nr:IL-6 subfamily cytokine M17 isoform X2 [Polypterus senegalus]
MSRHLGGVHISAAFMCLLTILDFARINASDLCRSSAGTQSKNLANLLKSEAETLVRTYIEAQGEGFPQSSSECKEEVSGFPVGDITARESPEMLQSIYFTLKSIDRHFKTILQQLSDLGFPATDPLQMKLKVAQERVLHLAANIKCMLTVPPPEVKIPPSVTIRGIYKQKKYGCTVLRKYSEFLTQVVRGLSHQTGTKLKKRYIHSHHARLQRLP